MALDAHQTDVLKTKNDKSIVLAGAGSGKTTTMIGRIMQAVGDEVAEKSLPEDIILESIDPKKIQAISFTNVASDTLKQRLEFVGGNEYKKVKVSTLDTLSINIIRHIYKNAIVSTDISTIAKDLYKHFKEELSDIFRSESDYLFCINKSLSKYANPTEKSKKTIYYDSLLRKYVSTILKDKKEDDTFLVPIDIVYQVAIYTMIQYRFIPDIELLIVDEVQDTSSDQFVLLKFLLAQLPELKFVGIGDLSQSMYRWNGAEPQHITQFIEDYNAEVKTLPNNYRSHPEIINFANKFLQENLDNISGIQLEAKSKVTFNDKIKDEERVRTLSSYETVLEDILTKIAQGAKPEDFVIASRANKNILAFETAFEEAKRKSGVYKKLKFNFSKHSKNVQIQFLDYVIRKLQYERSELNEIKNKDELLYYITNFFDELRKLKIYKSEDALANAAQTLESYKQLDFDSALEKMDNFIGNRLNYAYKKHEQTLFSTNILVKDEILVSTVHGIKGEEYKYVYYLPSITKSELGVSLDVPEGISTRDKELLYGDISEEQNIHYVAVTRAIEQLNIVFEDLYGMKYLIEERKAKGLSYNKDIDILTSKIELYEMDKARIKSIREKYA